jgi:hypothetical protein
MKILLMMVFVQSLNLVIFAWFNRVAGLRILALRRQLTVYKRKAKKPMLRNRDRMFWSLLSRIWGGWTSELILVRPETVIRWRERKFRDFCRRKSQGRSGRPAIPNEHVDFIRRISSDHPEYGEDRHERHLRCVLKEFVGWYNDGRVHQALNGIPDPDPVIDGPKPLGGRLVAIPVLNGLHHDYRLAA